ncbi:MAG: proprotein convertase P-domain-containing protein [Bryobacterales bacterium]|nr:proprotein convertase P-domain-containing protein [Bryobacterales bacterium]
MADLGVFNKMSPNGRWNLYVVDDTFPDGGEIQRGWLINFETGPGIDAIADTSTDEDQIKTLRVAWGDADTAADWFTTARLPVPELIKIDNQPATAALIKEIKWEDGSGYSRDLKITPQPNASGSLKIKVTINDDKGNSDNKTFTLNIRSVDDAPVILAKDMDNEKPLVIEKDEDAGKLTYVLKVKDVDSKLELKNASITSSNPSLVPNTKLETDKPGLNLVGPADWPAGTEQEITVEYRTIANAAGETDLVFSIRDAVNTSTKTVKLTVKAVNDAPTISDIKDVPSGDPMPPTPSAGSVVGPIAFTVGDIETEAKLLQVTAVSDNQALIPTANIALGGSGADRTITLTTIGNAAGFANITVTVKDDANPQAAATDSFRVTVQASTSDTIANTTRIDIKDNAKADPYPSPITLAGRRGKVQSVEVVLDGVTHNAPDDLDILLVSPDNRKVMLMSDAGGRNPINNARLTFRFGATPLPDDAPLSSGVYSPANYDAAVPDTMAAPAPAAPYGASLTDFQGGDVNGTWSLYVMDDSAGEAGVIATGWTLKVITAPEIQLVATVPPFAMVDGLPTVNADEDVSVEVIYDVFTEVGGLDKVANSYTTTNPTLIPATPTLLDEGITFRTPTASRRTAVMKPVANLSGDNLATIRVTRDSDKAAASIQIGHKVRAVNDLPAISRITSPQTTPENVPKTIDIRVTDPDTEVGKLTVKVFVDPASDVIDNAGISLNDTGKNEITLSGNDVRIVLTPKASKVGNATIKVEVTDKGVDPSVTTPPVSFVLTVNPVDDPPAIVGLPENRPLESGQTSTPVKFTVTDPDSASLTIEATSLDQTVIKSTSILVTMDEAGTIPGLTGPPGDRYLRVTAEPGISRETPVTVEIKVKDAQNPPVVDTITFNVRETRERSFANAAEITINPSGKATAYPSVIAVTDLVGNIESVKVSLNGFKHNFPDDVDIVLVSPDGKSSVIMSDAGGNTAIINGMTIKFDDAASNPIPDGSLVSATYKPFNYEGSSTDSWPDGPTAPAGGFTADLKNFKGAVASGDWKLYITDDTPSDGGAINTGWTLTVKTAPYIQGLADQVTPEDVEASQSFTIVDESFASDEFKLSGSSSNKNLVPDANITFGGSGYDRTVNIVPAMNQNGATDITVRVENKDGQIVESTFKLTVTPVNDPPFITQIPSPQVLAAGAASPVLTFSYGDVETDKKNLVITKVSDNPALLPVENIWIVGNTLQFAPVGVMTGEASVTLSTVDEAGEKTSMTFLVTVFPRSSSMFANTSSLTVPVSGSASVYPSTIEVADVQGLINRVTVTLVGVNHTYPDDLDVLLVSPSGDKVLLMSDAGGSVDLVNTRLEFADAAATGLPDNAQIASGTYKPTNHDGSGNDNFPGTPAGPIGSTLAALNGKAPNGVWSLYVVDDGAPDSGSITGGWILNIVTTSPSIAPVADQTLSEDIPLEVTVTVDDGDTPVANLTLTAVSSDEKVVGVSVSGAGNQRKVLLTPEPNAVGEATILLTVSDGTQQAATSFKATVEAVNDAPTITGLADATTSANITKLLVFEVGDVDDDITAVTVGASVDKPEVGTVTLTGEGVERTIVFVPSGIEGETTIAVTATDGKDTTEVKILMTVTPRVGPGVSPIADQSTPEDITSTVSFTVTSIDPATLVVSGTAADTKVIQSVTIEGTEGTRVAVVTPVPDASGSSEISITAVASFGSTTISFNMTVTAVNDAPVIGPIADQKTNWDAPVVVPLKVTDVDNLIADLVFSGSAADPTLVSSIGFVVQEGQAVATVVPVSGKAGTTVITISADDGAATGTQTFNLTVESPEPPKFTSITLIQGNPLQVRIEWTGDGVLQTASSVNGPWTDQPGAVSPVVVPVDPTAGQVFARIKR